MEALDAPEVELDEFSRRNLGGREQRREARDASEGKVIPRRRRDSRLGGRVGSGNDETPSSGSSTARSLDGEGQNRTADTTIFSRVLYQLSYLASGGKAR